MDTYFDPSTEEKEGHCFHTFLNQFGLVKTINFFEKGLTHIGLAEKFCSYIDSCTCTSRVSTIWKCIKCIQKKNQPLGIPKTFNNDCDTKQFIRWV